jgi:hypothetical protein
MIASTLALLSEGGKVSGRGVRGLWIWELFFLHRKCYGKLG